MTRAAREGGVRAVTMLKEVSQAAAGMPGPTSETESWAWPFSVDRRDGGGAATGAHATDGVGEQRSLQEKRRKRGEGARECFREDMSDVSEDTRLNL